MTLPSRPRTAARALVTALIAATAFVGLSGCGGSNGNSGSQAHIRSFDLCSNGGTATIFINNGSTNGTQTFEQTSGYLFLNGGNSTFTFTLSNAPAGSVYPSVTKSLTSGQYYSVILIGNANAATPATAGYPFLSVQQDDKTAPATGNARIRIVQAAPDTGAVDVLAGTQPVATGFKYGVIGVGTAPTVGTPTVTYMDVPAGSQTIQVNATGTTTHLFTPVAESLTAGHIYTLAVVETAFPATSTTPGTYGVYLTDDGA